jgi:hypothetical protein
LFTFLIVVVGISAIDGNFTITYFIVEVFHQLRIVLGSVKVAVLRFLHHRIDFLRKWQRLLPLILRWRRLLLLLLLFPLIVVEGLLRLILLILLLVLLVLILLLWLVCVLRLPLLIKAGVLLLKI